MRVSAPNGVAPTAEEVQYCIDMLVGHRAFLVEKIVRNNPQGAADAVQLKGPPNIQQLIALIMAMDAEEQAETLAAVPYIRGNDPILDAAVTSMFGIMQEHGGEGLQYVEGAGTQRFIVAAITTLASLVTGFAATATGQQAAGQAAGQAIYDNAYNAAKAAQAAQEQADLVKKWTPWAIGGLALLAVIIYIIARRP